MRPAGAVPSMIAEIIRGEVSELESHLQTKLFKRSCRSLVLTDSGSSYLALAALKSNPVC